MEGARRRPRRSVRLLQKKSKRFLLQKKSKGRDKSKKLSKKRKKSQKVRTFDGGNYKIVDTPKEKKKPWKIYSLEGCPYCTDGENLLKQNNIPVDKIDFNSLPESEQAKVLQEIDKDKRFKEFRTFPRIFQPSGDGHKFVGGYQQLKEIFPI